MKDEFNDFQDDFWLTVAENGAFQINNDDSDEIAEKSSKSDLGSERRPGDIHKNHRKRLDKKIEYSGFESLPDHEQLESILFVIIPRGDTNALAHYLLDEFGTLQGVLNAGFEKLQKVKGVGYRTARFLSQLNDVAGVILRNQQENVYCLDTSEKIRGYISTYYLGRLTECSYLFILDATKHLNGVIKLSDGTTSQTHIYPQKVAKYAVTHSAYAVIIAHNHPGGTLEPSVHDINVTKSVNAALAAVGVKLYDSVIVSGRNYFSFRDNGYLYKLKWINE